MEPLKVTRRTVSIRDIHPNTWNYRGMTDAMFQKEVTSIKTYGYIRPILVRARAGGGFEILDGEHRWRATDSLGFEEIDVDDLGTVDDRTAKKLTIVLNETHGEVRYDDLSKLVAELDAQGGHEDLLTELPFPDAELKALLMLPMSPDYDETSLDDIDDGEEREKRDSMVPEWDTLTLQIPAGLKERFEKAARELTADTKKIPKEVRAGLALERLLEAHEAQVKVSKKTPRSRQSATAPDPA